MKRHEWRERQETGEVKIFRATRHGGNWTLSTRLKTESEWTRHDPLRREDVVAIKEMLERKYQRNRVPYEDIARLEKLLKERR